MGSLLADCWRPHSYCKKPTCAETWSGTVVLLEHTEPTQGGDGLGRGTSWRHHLPGLQSLPDSRWSALFGSGTLSSSGSSESITNAPGQEQVTARR